MLSTLQDSYFISTCGLGGVGVADGVSGWADEGIDPAEYPRCVSCIFVATVSVQQMHAMPVNRHRKRHYKLLVFCSQQQSPLASNANSSCVLRLLHVGR